MDTRRDDLAFSLKYLESEARKAYSAQRIQDTAGNLEEAAKKGLAILDDIGPEFFQSQEQP